MKRDAVKTPTHRVAKRIKQFRNERDLRQVDMAESIGLSARHFQKIESGNTAVNVGMLEKISSTLNVPSCYLLKDGACAGLHEMGLACQVELLDYLKLAIVISDLTGQIVYANPLSLNILGDVKIEPKFLWDFLQDQTEKEKLKQTIKAAAQSRIEPETFSSQSAKIDWNYLNKGPNTVGMISTILL